MVDFTKNEFGNLTITLLPEGQAFLQDIVDNHDSLANPYQQPLDPDSVFLDLIEHKLCNGWTLVRPEQIGALTDATILTDDISIDDNGDVTECGKVFADGYYAFRSAADALYRTGQVIFGGHA